MAESFVTVAEYSQSFEAHLARGMLEAEGIKVYLSGDLTAETWMMLGLVKLEVSESDAPRALALLEKQAEEKATRQQGLEEATQDPSLWVCQLCGSAVGISDKICSGCATPRDAIREPWSSPKRNRAHMPKPSGPSEMIQTEAEIVPLRGITADVSEVLERGDFDADHSEEAKLLFTTVTGDDLAIRAFWAAVFGPLTCIVGTFYSLWLLARLLFHPGELSGHGMRHMVGALVIDVLMVLVVILLRFTWRPVW